MRQQCSAKQHIECRSIATTSVDLRAILEQNDEVAVEQRLHFANLGDADDRRARYTNEALWIEAGLEAGHRLAHLVLFRTRMDLDVVSCGDDAIDFVDVEQSNATLGADRESRRVMLRFSPIDQFQGLGNATDEAVVRMGQA